MNPRSDSNSLNIDAPGSAPAPTSHDSLPASSASVPASAFADDTRRDQTIGEDQTPGEASQNVRSPRNGALWLLLSLLAFYSVFSLGAWSAKRSSQPPVVGPFASRSTTGEAKVVVHVAGAVRHPGVYTLPNNARIYEALHLAGGALPQASTDTLNLADWAQDGARIEVPFKTNLRASANAAAPLDTTRIATPEPAAQETTSTISDKAIVTEATATPEDSSSESQSDVTQGEKAPNETAPSTAAPTPISPQSSTRLSRANAAKAAQTGKTEKPRPKKTAAKTQSKTVAGLPRALTPDGKLSDNASPQYLQKHPLDLNKITREQLEALPGVGPSLAQKILDYRKQNGGFKNVEDLDNVNGIGEKKLAALKPLLYVVGAPAAANQSDVKSP